MFQLPSIMLMAESEFQADAFTLLSFLVLGIASLIIAILVFFDPAVIILMPIAIGIARKTKKSVLLYAIPLLAGLSVGHAFLPPTPGPVIVATQLGVDLGLVIIVGLICGSIAMICAGPIFGTYIGNKINISIIEDNQSSNVLKKIKNSLLLVQLLLSY